MDVPAIQAALAEQRIDAHRADVLLLAVVGARRPGAEARRGGSGRRLGEEVEEPVAFVDGAIVLLTLPEAAISAMVSHPGYNPNNVEDRKPGGW